MKEKKQQESPKLISNYFMNCGCEGDLQAQEAVADAGGTDAGRERRRGGGACRSTLSLTPSADHSEIICRKMGTKR